MSYHWKEEMIPHKIAGVYSNGCQSVVNLFTTAQCHMPENVRIFVFVSSLMWRYVIGWVVPDGCVPLKCCWAFGCSEMWHCITEWLLTFQRKTLIQRSNLTSESLIICRPQQKLELYLSFWKSRIYSPSNSTSHPRPHSWLIWRYYHSLWQ
jgi:hypothetical protein